VKVYLDNCCFNRPYDNQSYLSIRLETEAKLHIQDLTRDKRLDLVWSYILDFENRRNPFEERRTEIALWRDMATVIVEPDREIGPLGKELEELGLKPLDALHVSCAIRGGCEYFLTVDRGVLKKKGNILDIAIISPIEFLGVLEDLQDD
jgi:hypothetical protein